MPRPLTMAAFVIGAATLACSAAPTADESLSRDVSQLRAACPAIAATCPAGCFLVGAYTVDRQNACLQPFQAWGCSAVEVGPPALFCSVSPDGTIWISMENRSHPQGRSCTDEERKALSFSKCP